MTYMLLLNCALKLVEEIILYYYARSKKHQNVDTNFSPGLLYFMRVIYGVLLWIYRNIYSSRYKVIMRYKDSKR